jgi:hypothetical protein
MMKTLFNASIMKTITRSEKKEMIDRLTKRKKEKSLDNDDSYGQIIR